VSYTELAASALAVAVALDVVVLRTRLVCSRAFWCAYGIMLFFQLIVNGMLTGLSIVRYNPDTIIGWRIAYAPVEDLAFGFALILATVAPWAWLTTGRPHDADHPADRRGDS
jgi:lycopene cyclase domain-containing protein